MFPGRSNRDVFSSRFHNNNGVVGRTCAAKKTSLLDGELSLAARSKAVARASALASTKLFNNREGFSAACGTARKYIYIYIYIIVYTSPQNFQSYLPTGTWLGYLPLRTPRKVMRSLSLSSNSNSYKSALFIHGNRKIIIIIIIITSSTLAYRAAATLSRLFPPPPEERNKNIYGPPRKERVTGMSGNCFISPLRREKRRWPHERRRITLRGSL